MSDSLEKPHWISVTQESTSNIPASEVTGVGGTVSNQALILREGAWTSAEASCKSFEIEATIREALEKLNFRWAVNWADLVAANGGDEMKAALSIDWVQKLKDLEAANSGTETGKPNKK